jgi:hypothetical protein
MGHKDITHDSFRATNEPTSREQVCGIDLLGGAYSGTIIKDTVAGTK